MDERRDGERRWALPLMVAALGCVLALGAVGLLRPQSFSSHEETIGYALDQRGIAYERILLAQTRLDTINFYSYTLYSQYGADVTVQLAGGERIFGRVECRKQRSSCYLYLKAVGIVSERLPELTSGQQLSLVDRLRAYLSSLPLLNRFIS